MAQSRKNIGQARHFVALAPKLPGTARNNALDRQGFQHLTLANKHRLPKKPPSCALPAEQVAPHAWPFDMSHTHAERQAPAQPPGWQRHESGSMQNPRIQ